MDAEIQTDFECVEKGCENRVSVYDDNDMCVECRRNTAEIPEDKEIWGMPHTS
jgi:hypothetical protein